MTTIVIVGAGQAGVTAAEALRAGGFGGAITLLGDEPHGPYHRPPLSKAWLSGQMQAAQLVLRSAEALARKQIMLRSGVSVQAIDRMAQELVLAGGERLAYSGLVLAMGARPRRLPLPGADAPNVHHLRGQDDAAALARQLDGCAASGRALVVVGGGFIGLEVAATARRKGVAVTVLEALPRLLARVLPPVLSAAFEDLHRGHGVQVLTGVQVAGLLTDGAGLVTAVQLADGRCIDCGAVLVGIGAVPNDELARAAGLACDRGVIVDACGRTADAAIVAAGDVTARRAADGNLLRLESVQAATEGAKSAAAALLGQERPFVAAPWFWSDQYDVKLQMAGLAAGADSAVVRGTLAQPPASVWHYRGDRLLAVDTLNDSKTHLLARRLLDAGIGPTPVQAADAAFDLASVSA